MRSTICRNSGSSLLRGCWRVTAISAAMRPGLEDSTTMRSHISTASSMLCVTMRIDLMGMRPSTHRSRRSVRSVSAVSTSSAEKGSSMSRICGLTTSARAKPTRWRMPPDSSLGKADSKPSSPIRSMAASARLRASASGTPLARSPSSTLPSTLSQGNRAKLWNTMATPSTGPATSAPP